MRKHLKINFTIEIVLKMTILIYSFKLKSKILSFKKKIIFLSRFYNVPIIKIKKSKILNRTKV